MPGYNGGPGLPSLPGIGGGSLPSFEGPSESNPFETQPLIWFERGEGDFDFPTFKYEDLFDSIEEKFKEKFPLDWLEKLTTTDGTKIDLSWKVEFDWYEQKYGPWEFDLSEHVEAYEKMDISRIIRLILLFILCWIFLNSVLSLIFDSKA